MTHHTEPTNRKAPGAINTEGLTTKTTNDLNFATSTRNSKAIATEIAKLAIWGYACHQLKDGRFLVCKYGHTFHANDCAELKFFARRLGVSQ